MKKVIFSMLLPLMAMVVISSCKKIDESVVPTPSYAEMITATKWRLETVKQFNSGYTYTVYTYANADACERDNYSMFSSDGSGYDDEGGSKCYSDDPQRTTYKWSFSDDMEELKLKYYQDGYGSYTTTYKIKEITSEKLSYTLTQGSSTYTLTYEPK